MVLLMEFTPLIVYVPFINCNLPALMPLAAPLVKPRLLSVNESLFTAFLQSSALTVRVMVWVLESVATDMVVGEVDGEVKISGLFSTF